MKAGRSLERKGRKKQEGRGAGLTRPLRRHPQKEGAAGDPWEARQTSMMSFSLAATSASISVTCLSVTFWISASERF